jgi:hypothetical protein
MSALVVLAPGSRRQDLSRCVRRYLLLPHRRSPRTQQHELPRFAIIGPTIDSAGATFTSLVGILDSSAVLRCFTEGEHTAESVPLRRPDGRCVDIVVVAANGGGLSVRNRWLVGFLLDWEQFSRR